MVWKAQNVHSGEIVAAKVHAANQLTKINRGMACLLNERDIHAKLAHGTSPFVVSLLATFKSSDHFFLVTDFVPNGNLQQHISTMSQTMRSEPGGACSCASGLQTDEIRRLAVELSQALLFIHRYDAATCINSHPICRASLLSLYTNSPTLALQIGCSAS